MLLVMMVKVLLLMHYLLRRTAPAHVGPRGTRGHEVFRPGVWWAVGEGAREKPPVLVDLERRPEQCLMNNAANIGFMSLWTPISLIMSRGKTIKGKGLHQVNDVVEVHADVVDAVDVVIEVAVVGAGPVQVHVLRQRRRLRLEQPSGRRHVRQNLSLSFGQADHCNARRICR